METQEYERICDVPKGMVIMCPWLVRATSYKHPRVRTFEFELNYGALPQYWPGWKDFPDWSYAWTIKKPQDFDRHFRVL